MWGLTERRKIRTKTKGAALLWFLRRRLLRSTARALVVASSEGYVLSQCGDGVDPRWAAALAPSISRHGWTYPRPVHGDVWVEAVPVDHDVVYLFVLGGRQPVTRIGCDTKEGIRRILEE